MKLLALLLAASPLALAGTVLEARADSDPEEWIVVLKPGMTTVSSIQTSIESVIGTGSTSSHFQVGDFQAMSVNGTKAHMDDLALLDMVDFIEPNYKTSVQAIVTQSAAPWGLARISHRNKGVTGYRYDSRAGVGTYAYILDTGIQLAHPQFGGRAVFGASFIDGQVRDLHGHGTHVAGIVGSNTYGVAKKTTLIAVKVLRNDGSGTVSQAISGIEWAVQNAINHGRLKKSVVNMSLTAPASVALQNAAQAAVNQGMFLAVAAGNQNALVKTQSPSNAPGACTVGATNGNDARADFSNYGSLIDIWAPGVDIRSTYLNGGTTLFSGTSQATPHVAGLAAYIMSIEGYRAPRAMCTRLQTLSTKGIVTGSKSDIKMLAYNGV